MSTTENSPFTNGIGVALVALAMVGLLFVWFWPDSFYGSITQVSVVGGLGLAFILGFSDEIVGAFVKAMIKGFNKLLGVVKTGKTNP